MCGIAGLSWPDEILIRESTALLTHRGPDNVGSFTDANVSLGHARLKVVDLSDSANQPMVDPASGLVLVFNGEIYNYRELRDSLQALGHRFETDSDTEVFLRAYKQWGTESFGRFNGMWAACIYSRSEQSLVLTRDRFGKKPLYYTQCGRGLAFASELKSLLPLVETAEIDPEAVDFLLSSQFVPSPMTMFRGIRKIEPRQFLRYRIADRHMETGYYYEIPRYAPTHDRAALVREGRALLEDAVRVRMHADVPLGAFLSGGLDSTAIVALMRKLAPERETSTLSVGFDAPGADESPYAELAARTLGTRHNCVYFRSENVGDVLKRALWAYDDLVADPASLPLYVLCEETRKHMTVALSGDGGDEVFGGYEVRQLATQMSLLRKVPEILRRALHGALVAVRGNRLDRLGFITEALRVSLLRPEQFFAELGASFVYRPPAFLRWATQRLQEMLEKSDGNLTEAMLKFDMFFNRLGDNYCAKVDRMSMAHGLEVRSPFLDYRFAAFASKIPVKWKLNTRKTKVIMRQIVHDLLPPAILRRGKQGFGSPLEAWLDGKDDELKQGLELLHRRAVLNDAWYRFFLDKVFGSSHFIYREHRKRLYVLLCWYAQWGSGRFVDGEHAGAERLPCT